MRHAVAGSVVSDRWTDRFCTVDTADMRLHNIYDVNYATVDTVTLGVFANDSQFDCGCVEYLKLVFLI